jgi:hypothetical protein
MPCNVKTRRQTSATPASACRRKPAPQPAGRAAERLAVRAEAAAQAPWREAIAQARVAERAIRQARAAKRQKQPKKESSPSPLEGLGREERTKGGVRGQHAMPYNVAKPPLPRTSPSTRPSPLRRLPPGRTRLSCSASSPSAWPGYAAPAAPSRRPARYAPHKRDPTTRVLNRQDASPYNVTRPRTRAAQRPRPRPQRRPAPRPTSRLPHWRPSTAPRGATSNTSSDAAIAPPARTHDPAPRGDRRKARGFALCNREP